MLSFYLAAKYCCFNRLVGLESLSVWHLNNLCLIILYFVVALFAFRYFVPSTVHVYLYMSYVCLHWPNQESLTVQLEK